MKYRAMLLSFLMAGALILPVSAVALTQNQTAEPTNSAPIAENLTLSTYKGIAITSRFAAVDPDGDEVTFQVVDSPARGQVTVDENDPTVFWYTPYEGKKGKDAFTYVAVDSKGNISEPAKVKITIAKQSTKVTYSDMTGDPNHYAALRLAETGVYVGRKVGNVYCFDPSETFTREEFLAMAMTVAGVDPLTNITLTGFYDDQDIPTWAKGYVSAALMGGTVRGCRNEQGQVVFNVGAQVTRAEAVVIIDRLLNVSDVAVQTMAVESAVPAWARQSAANMKAVSVLSATGSLSEPLSRSEAAQMLAAMQDVIDSRSTGWFK